LSLTLREERRLRLFDSSVLRRIFGTNKDELKKKWRKLHNVKFNDLYSSPNIFRAIKSRRMRWAGHIARMVKRRRVYRVLVGKSEGKRPLGRRRLRCEIDISMDDHEDGCGSIDGIEMAQEKYRWWVHENALMKFRVS